MTIRFRRDSGTVTWTNSTGASIASGTPVNVVDRVGITAETIANGASGTVYVSGVFRLNKLSTTAFAEGADVDWDNTNNRADELGVGASGDFLHIGKCVAAADNTKSYVDVEINVPITMEVVA